MGLDLAKVGLAVQGGLSSVCATCTRYWEARDKRLPEPQCLAKDGCGSPLRGDDFHEYLGPISDFGRWCFVCGADAHYGVRVQGRKRAIGMCEQHLKLLTELRPMDATDVAIRNEVHNGTFTIPIERLLGPKKKSLAAAIFEVESYYAKKNGTEIG